ncbi:MAG: glycosyltransferase family 2 protein [Syntrophaceae bacterium]|nr:glycosyltransferase family 2 protein [Syntrophaceae bacterium]
MDKLTDNFQPNQRVCITVLGYNNIHDTLECLESISQLEGGQFPVLFVDNGSEDNSSDIVKKHFPSVHVLRLSSNLGFSGGTNKGLGWVCGQGYEFCLILNNDVMLDQAMVNEMLSVADNHENCAVVMPRIMFIPPKVKTVGSRKNIWSDGGYYRKFPPTIKLKDNRRNINFEVPRAIEFAPGCALLIRCEVLEKVGSFDERFFLFYEDWDFSIRVREACFSIWCAPAATLFHKVSMSTMKNPYFYWEHMGASMSLFFSKHFNRRLTRSNIWFRIIRDFFFKPTNFRYLAAFRAGARKGNSVSRQNLSVTANSFFNQGQGGE